MNNKGFAITAVIYGLAILGFMIIAILMGTLSSTRNNVSEEAQMVEDFLIAANQTEVTYHGAVNTTYRVPLGESGWYRFEAFGASMGQSRGAYATGIIYLNESEVVSIIITNQASIVQMGSEVLMKAAGATSTTVPGGDICSYSAAPTGGKVDMNLYQLLDTTKSYTGIDDITFSNCNNEANSFIIGHPSTTRTTVGNHDYYFLDGFMAPAANASGEGKIIIQRLAERDESIPNIPRKNTKMNGVTKITITGGLNVQKIRYTYHAPFNDGKFVLTVGECTGTECTIPGGAKDIDEISIILNSVSYKSKIRNASIVLNTTSGQKTIYSVGSDYGTTPGPEGIHISAYQPDSVADNGMLHAVNNFPDHGNYYIIPVVTANMLVSATSTANEEANQLKIDYFTGESRQKWSIDLLNKPGLPDESPELNFPHVGNRSNKKEYRITELTRFKSLNIYYDENYKMNFVSASETFNTLSRNEPQIWNILPMGDGTYAIKTVVPSFTISEKSGFLFAKPCGETSNNDNDIMIGLTREYNDTSVDDKNTTPTSIERFVLYSLDFSA